MRDLALRPFAPIVLSTAMMLLLSASAASQTAPPASAAEPATLQESQHPSSVSNDVPAVLLEVLRKEKVALTFLESPRLDPQARASLMRSLKQHFPAGHVVRGAEEADVVVAIGVFIEGQLATPESHAAVPEEGDEKKKIAARTPFRVLVFRPAAPTETVVLYESASVARGGVSQRTGLDKRRAALDLAMKNLGVIATVPAEKK